jgi:hypothetical protein
MCIDQILKIHGDVVAKEHYMQILQVCNRKLLFYFLKNSRAGMKP